MDKLPKALAKDLSDLAGKDFLSCSDFTCNQISSLLNLASQFKEGKRRIDLGNRVLGLVFTKPSTRTRVSFHVAMARLGAQTIDLSSESTQLGRGEPLRDTARVLSRYCDALAIRTFGNDELIEYAEWSSIPVINALTDLEHPCQALADFLTIQEEFGSLKGVSLAYIGDGNNVANSLLLLGAIMGVNIRLACPKGFQPQVSVIEKAKSLSSSSNIEIYTDPLEAINGCNVIYTDVWASMGQEQEKLKREKAFKGFTVNNDLINAANQDAIFLHCLPAHRGEEVDDQLLESRISRVFDQAENRLHAQQALIAALLGGL